MSNLMCPFPANVNPLRLTQYQFQVEKLPELTYFVQNASVPDISLGVSTQASSVHDIKIPGETMEFGSLQIEFVVDEDLKNWNSIYFWMIGMGYPEGHHLYTGYMNSQKNANRLSELAKGYSDGTLALLDSSNNPKQVYTFVDMFPTQLQGLSFSSNSGQAEVATASVVFEYSYYKINKKIDHAF